MEPIRTSEHWGEKRLRQEYGVLVAVLSRRFGVQHIEAIEDALQSAWEAALGLAASERPEHLSAWLLQVAQRNLLGELRQRTSRQRLLQQQPLPELYVPESDGVFAAEVKDELLRMLFICCHESIPTASQLVLALKVLCGFDVRGIALRLFASEANVYKRLSRGRERLREVFATSEEELLTSYGARLPAVQKILYILFTEGYLSSHGELSIRRELCHEAMRLAMLLAEHPVCGTPETHALLALMHLHLARMTARVDGTGGLLLLDEQDRSLWDGALIHEGMSWLARSARGDVFSRYHAEAGIAAEHCLAPSFAETHWERVVSLYALLEQSGPSAIHRLNRAIAVAEWKGAKDGLTTLDGMEPPTWLTGSYLWAAVKADLHRRCGDEVTAQRYVDIALETAPSDAIRKLLRRRLYRV